MSESTNPGNHDNDPNTLPFAAPCKDLSAKAPLNWVKLGWQDVKRAPKQSIGFGALLVVLSYLVAGLAISFGNWVVLIAMLSGFVFVGPIIALTFYDISQRLQEGKTPTMGGALRASLKHVGNHMVFAVILMVIFLVWARAASMTHVFFPALASPKLADLALFLGIGSAIGSVFATVVFCVSAFSLPMIIDRDADMVTAVVTSFNAVLRNKPAMVVWVLLIVAAVGIGIVTAFIGLAVTLPLIGHATWHAYQETIDASAWPMHK